METLMDNRKELGKNRTSSVSIRYTQNVTVQFSNRKCDWKFGTEISLIPTPLFGIRRAAGAINAVWERDYTYSRFAHACNTESTKQSSSSDCF